MNPHPPTSSRAFTLIELLIVISIIGILMAMLFPAVQSALQSARRASAQNDVVQIATAVVAYETDYGRLPPDNTVVGGDLLNALMATETNNNRRAIVFLEAPNFRRNRGGVTNAGASGSLYLDPWAGTYQIAMDTDYDPTTTLEVGGGQGPQQENIRRRVGVWNTNETQRLRVGSW